jgi:multidrug efflux pump
MRHAMGVAVFAGMIGVTLFGIFLTPVFYVLLRQLSGNRPFKVHGVEHAAPLAAEAPAVAMHTEAVPAAGNGGDR